MRLIGVTILLSVAALAAIFLIGGIGLLIGRWATSNEATSTGDEATSSTSTTTPAPSDKPTSSSTGQTTTTTTTFITNTTPPPRTSSASTTTTTIPTTPPPATPLSPPLETTQPTTTTTMTTTSMAKPAEPTECEDNRPSCKKYRKAGFCSAENMPKKVKIWLHANCRSSCGLCGGSASTTTNMTPEPGASSCFDQVNVSTCQRWASHGNCDKPEIRKLCMKSCQACESTNEAEETTTTAANTGCSNKASALYCFVFSLGGLCSRKPDVANEYCEKKCGLCSPTKTVIVALVRPSHGCSDRLPGFGCRALTSIMGCKKRSLPGMMCSKTCQLCDGDQDESDGEETNSQTSTSTATATNCHNRATHTKCSVFAAHGECSNMPDLAIKFCKQTCGLCSQPESAVSTSMQRTQPCKDKLFSFGCRAMASFMGCNKLPSTTLCRKTCQLCDVRKEEDGDEEEEDGDDSDEQDSSDTSDESDSEVGW